MITKKIWILIVGMLFVAGCGATGSVDNGGGDSGGSSGNSSFPQGGSTGTVTRVIDGDTIEVDINGTIYDVRYVGVNTPERDQSCYDDATNANAQLVSGEEVRLERDESNIDQYDRLLRYVYTSFEGEDVMVNRYLVANGWAEAALYQPDDEYYSEFRDLEIQATNQNLGCHPTGIFDDGSLRR